MKKYICEFVGTFVLTLVGCGVAVVTGANVVATSLAFGLTIVAMAYSIGNVSGCHINPAVSLSMLMTKKMTLKEFAFYVVAQILGAIAAAAVLGVLLSSFKALGANTYGADGQLATNVWIALLVECILTFIFVTAILGVTSKKENNAVAGLVIGLTLTLVHLLGISFTGTSVNPARSLGPAILMCGTALKQVWVFVVAPLVGATLASLFYKGVLKEK
ncbi:MAG: aquaporin [Bacilli bacterium]|nr:aquaporin [Bacilli bacterium]